MSFVDAYRRVEFPTPIEAVGARGGGSVRNAYRRVEFPTPIEAWALQACSEAVGWYRRVEFPTPIEATAFGEAQGGSPQGIVGWNSRPPLKPEASSGCQAKPVVSSGGIPDPH